MSEFNSDKYFETRDAAARQDNLDDSWVQLERRAAEKKAELQHTNLRKLEALGAHRDQGIANEDSWVGQMGLDPRGPVGTPVNAAASLISAGTRNVGEAITAIPNMTSAELLQQTDDDVREAFSRSQRGIATPDDEALLDQPYTGAYDVAQQAGNIPAPDHGTIRERLTGAVDQLESSAEFTDGLDISGIVHQGRRSNFSSDLAGERFEAGEEQLRDSLSQFEDGEILSGIDQGARGLANLLMQAGGAALKNPGAMLEYAAELVPQLAIGAVSTPLMATQTMGYAFDEYNRGIQKYAEENDGALPPDDLNEHMLKNSLVAGSVNYVGNLGLLRTMRAAAPGAQGAQTGFRQGVQNVAKAGAKGATIEAGTEAVQTYTTAEARLEPASAFEIFEGTAIGGGSGAGVAAPGRAISEIAGATPEHQEQRRSAADTEQRVVKASETGDVSPFLDPETNDYSPQNAVRALIEHSLRDEATEQDRESAQTQITEIINTLAEETELNQRRLDQTAPEMLPKHRETRNKAQQKLERLDPSETAEAERLQGIVERLDGILAREEALTPKQKKERKQKQEDNQRILETTRQQAAFLDQMTKATPENMAMLRDMIDGVERNEAGEAVPTAQTSPEFQAVASKQFVRHAMTNPDSVSTADIDALTENTTNGLTGEQRSYLRSISEARLAANALQSLDGVRKDVLTGSRDFKGIDEYRSDMARNIAAGNQETAQQQLTGITDFAASREAKARVARQAYDQVKGTDNTISIVRDMSVEGEWTQADEVMSQKAVEKAGGLNISKKSAKVVPAIETERDAIQAAAQELQGAYDVAFRTNTPAESDQVTQGDSAPTQETAQQPSQEASEATAQPSAEVSQEQDTAPTETTEQPTQDDADLAAMQAEDQAMATSEQTQTQEDTTRATAEETAPQAEAEARETESTESDAVTQTTDQTTEESAPVERESGVLSLLQDTSKKVSGLMTNAAFKTSNLLQAYFTQRTNSERFNTKLPLVDRKGFLSALREDTTLAEEYLNLPEGLNEQQHELLQMFSENAEVYNDFLTAIITKDPDTEFHHRHQIQYFLDENGNMDENVKTAISFASFSYVGEEGGRRAYNDDDAINSMLGRHSESMVSQDERAMLQFGGIHDKLVINNLGKRVAQALGLRTDKNAPVNTTAQLEGALGAYALGILMDQGLMERHQVKVYSKGSRIELEPFKDSTKFTWSLVRPAMDQNNQVTPEAKRISDTYKGTQSVLGKLFGAQLQRTEPSYVPLTLDQTTTKNTDRGIPSLLKSILDGDMQKGWVARQDMDQVYRKLYPNVRGAIAGVVDPNTRRVHKANEIGLEGRNEGLLRELEEYDRQMEQLTQTEDGLAQKLYLNRSVWKMQRVGIDGVINPQSSKVHRHLFAMDGWETTIKLDNADEVANFKLAVAEAFGIKTDKKYDSNALAEFEKKAEKQVIKDGVDALRRAIYEDADLGPADQQAIQDAVTEAGKAFHSLDGLVNLAHFEQANTTQGTAEFTTSIMREVDGVTNGPMLAHLLLGADMSPDALLRTLNRGGFFQQDSPHNNNVDYRSGEGSRDLYENMAASVADFMGKRVQGDPSQQAFYDAIFTFTKPLLDAGAVSSGGRKVVKTPLTAMAFGSSVANAVDGMADELIENMYNHIEDLANENDTAGLREAINQIVRLIEPHNERAAKQFRASVKENGALQTEFNKAQIAAIKASFNATMGDDVAQTMDGQFRQFIETRSQMNKAAQLSFELYNVSYQALKQDLVETLVRNGEIAVNDKGVPLQDITREHDQMIREQLKHMEPAVHTYMSKHSGELQNGLYMSKASRGVTDHVAYTNEAHFSRPVKNKQSDKKGQKALISRGVAQTEINPGVATLIMMIHSTDSAISALSYEGQNALNVHDAHGLGLNDVAAGARRLNENTFKVTADYSIPMELFSALERTLDGFHQMKNELEGSPAMASAYQHFSNELVKRMGTEEREYFKRTGMDPVAYTISEIGIAAFNAERTKLDTMAKLKSVDQYAFEGGEYQVTDADRAMIAEKRQELDAFNPDTAVKKAQEINQVLKGVEIRSELFKNARDAINTTGMETVDTQKKGKKAKKTSTKSVLTAPTAQMLPVLEYGIANTTNETLKSAMETVHDHILSEKVGYEQASERVLSPVMAAQVTQYLNQTYNNNRQTPWGEVGVPLIDSDQALVQYFEEGHNITAGKLISFLRRENNKTKPKKGETGQQPRMAAFNGALLAQLQKTVKKDMPVHYIREGTPAPEGITGKVDKARGWYTESYDGGSINIKSTDFVDSGITTEMLIHELTHAALSDTISAEQNRKAANPKYTSQALALVNELETLREKAAERVNDSPELKARFGNAVSNVHELTAWGMSNNAFQREVLNQITMEPTQAENTLVQESGIQKFIKAITGLLFRGSQKSQQAINENGMSILIANVSGLFGEAADVRERQQNVIHKYEDPADPLTEAQAYTTEQVFDALEQFNTRGQDPAFTDHLRRVMNTIVERVHGPFGVFKAEANRNQAYSAEDVFLNTLMSDQLPFASKALAQELPLSDQQAFVLEQVEITSRAALETDSLAARELKTIYNEARARIKARDFYPGDWAQATPREQELAQNQWNAVFMAEQQGQESDYLSRFAALGLTYKPLNDLLQIESTRDTRRLSNMKLGEALATVFNRMMRALGNKVLGTHEGQPLHAKLQRVVHDLAAVEARKKTTLAHEKGRAMEAVENSSQQVGDAVRGWVERTGRSKMFQNSKSGIIQAAGNLTSAVAGNRFDKVIEFQQRLRDKNFQTKQGVVSALVTELQGATDATRPFWELNRQTKKNERDRQTQNDVTRKFILESFEDGGKHITENTQKAEDTRSGVTKVLLRTGAADLLEGNAYSVDDITAMVADPKKLREVIAKEEQALKHLGSPHLGFYSRQAKNLGYHNVTGLVAQKGLLFNAHNIAHMYGTAHKGTVTQAEANAAMPIIDRLISLRGIEQAPSYETSLVRELMLSEQKRGTDSGIVATLKYHKHMLDESKRVLFDGDPAHVKKGYTPEILNHYKQTRVAGQDEGRQLEQTGWSKGPQVAKDKADPDQEVKHIYVIRDGGLQARVTGNMSYTSEQSRGSAVHDGLSTMDGIHRKNKGINDTIKAKHAKDVEALMVDDPNYDPSQVQDTNHLVPTFDRHGEIVNYRYMMSDSAKDNTLDRTNEMEHVLGAMAASVYDKQASKTQNRAVVEALHEQWKKEFIKRPESYRVISPKSKDPELREMYWLLPDDTRKAIKEVWGKDEMSVRADLMDINFGYKKYSLSDIWGKTSSERGVMEHLFKGITELFLGKKAALRVRQAEDVNRELVKMTKDNLVVKNLAVTLMNFSSNVSQLVWFGVPLKDIARNGMVAIRGTLQYRRDEKELLKLQKMRDSGIIQGDLSELNQRIIALEDALAKNPMKEMVDEGLYQSIIEDIDVETDQYSYKSLLMRKTDRFTRYIPDSLRTVAKTAVMAHDTPLYKLMSNATMFTDFASRYILHEHMTKRAKDPMSKSDSLLLASEAFVNYDVPTHRTMQYLNDMGLILFSKYYLRIQKILLRLARDNPARTLGLIAFGNVFPNASLLTEVSMANRLGSPLRDGGLAYPDSITNTLPFDVVGRVFN